MMLSRRVYLIGLPLLLALLVFGYWVVGDPLSPFIYTKTDDFYSHISKEDSPDQQLKMVVPYGVFFVKKEGSWVHVARMDVSVIECDAFNGKRDEGTIYKKHLEYWFLDLDTEKVIGPLDEARRQQFIKSNELQEYATKIPESYLKYVNDYESACGD
ncbi:hypothetical protein QT397_14340 [Microbulbifer sp. MKSA007]|nr:hypothetical protein QT397_14340 [Microbulbifer sp. MKSA007]